jgi:hypothetical protein
MKKLIPLTLIFTTLLSSSIFAQTSTFEISQGNVLISNDNLAENSNISVTATEGIIIPRDAILLDNVRWQSRSAFDRNIQTSTGNGKNLNVYIANNTLYENGAYGDVGVRITDKSTGNVVVSEVLYQGASRTWTISSTNGTDLNKQFNIYVYCYKGNTIDLQVSARQY